METRKKQNELISRCRSRGSMPGRKMPAATPRSRMLATSARIDLFSERITCDWARCAALWMFSMLTRRMKSTLLSWCSKVNSTMRRSAASGSS
ncbi:hypothetical protein D3C86_1793670 [compost metagenome]